MTADARDLFIRQPYAPRLKPVPFEDDLVTTEGIVHQPMVYPFAGFLGERFGCRRIIDVGCGSARKLVGLHLRFDVLGIDREPNLERARRQLPSGTWIPADLESLESNLLAEPVLRDAVVVCSDVVEHLVDPSALLRSLRGWLETSPLCLISTPDRNLARGAEDHGPPANRHHVREWSLNEFEQLLAAFDLAPTFIGLTLNNSLDREKKTILAVIDRLRFPSSTPTDFRVLAILAVRNEIDIIVPSVRRLLDQGIDVHVIDDWSEDGTWEALRALGAGNRLRCERFPDSGPSGAFQWERLLQRKEEIAASSRADWVIHQDADEIRESPWPGISLRDGLYRVENAAFNAVDHTVIDFKPTDDSFLPGSDFGSHFSHFDFGRRPGHFVQIKAWKPGGGKVDLAASGGHEAAFEGRRVFPYKFLLRHYPFRSTRQAESKLAERKLRFDAAERARGWHHHYDQLTASSVMGSVGAGTLRYEAEDFSRAFLVERLSGLGLREGDFEPAVERATPEAAQVMGEVSGAPRDRARIRSLRNAGRENYSDGDSEARILEAIRNRLGEEEIMERLPEWAVLYHFSPERRNLLSWFDFQRDARLLEVGAGCGALTGLFCERVSSVTALELSERRAEITARRHAACNNLEVVVGNLSELEAAEPYDYVTLIGVLEYAERFTASSEPAIALLREAWNRLRPGGLLFLAIENRFGLKYWAGSREDHTGRLFDGLEGYPTPTGARTYGRRELENLVIRAGFGDLNFLYPHPDYKLPSAIYSDEWPPKPGEIVEATPSLDQERFTLFDEVRVWDALGAEGVFPFFANSFLVVAERPDR